MLALAGTANNADAQLIRRPPRSTAGLFGGLAPVNPQVVQQLGDQPPDLVTDPAHRVDPLSRRDLWRLLFELWGRRGKDSKYTRVAPTKVTPMLAALGMGGLNSVRAPLPNEREAIALESIKIAVEAGAPVEAADQDGRTALEVATALRYKSVIDYLTSKGAKLDRPARPLPRVRVEEN